MKKIISILFILSILLSACQTAATSTSESPATEAPATQTAGTEISQPAPTVSTESRLTVKEEALKGLEITVWYPWYGPEASLFDSFVEEFNKKNEWGIKVSAQGQSNFTNLYEEVNASLPTENKPNMVIALPENALEWNNQRVVTDLTPYVSDPKYGIDSSDFPAIFWNQDVIGDVRVAVPAQRTARLLLWNETWASEMGFDAPPQTPDDFRQQACRAQSFMLKDADPQNDGMGGWMIDTHPMTAYAWLLGFDGGVLEGNDYRFLTPNNIESFKFLSELPEKKCAWRAGNADPAAMFGSRQTLLINASLDDLPAVTRAFASANNTDTWKVAPYPGVTKGVMPVYGSSYVVLTSTDEKQLASWLFIRWLLDQEQDKRWVETTHLFPLRTSTLDLLGDYKKSHPQWAQAIDLLPQAVGEPQLASWRKVKVMVGDGFAHMFRVNVPSGQVAAILAQMEAISRDLSD